MKVHFALILASALLPIACGQATESVNAVKDALASVSSEDQAANEIYLTDIIESAADDSSVPSDEGSSEIKDDIKAERLKQMTEMLFKRLDTDASGSLSLDEYLVGPIEHASKTGMDAEKLAAIKAKMTEDFNKAAGDDKVLSMEETQALLKACAPRIGLHRKGKHPEGQAERVKKSSSEIIKEFDKDADGKLNEAELEAFRAAKRAEMEEFRRSKGHSHGRSGEGRGGESESESGSSGSGETNSTNR